MVLMFGMKEIFLIGIIIKEDETLAPAASGAPAYLSLVDADGQNIRFSAETGAVVARCV